MALETPDDLDSAVIIATGEDVVDLAYSHLALFVPDLQTAERFYHEAFGLEVAFREVEAASGDWYTLPPGKGWDDATEAGIEIDMVALRGDRIVLPLFRGQNQPGTVLEIGLNLPSNEQVEEMADRIPKSATRLTHEHGDLFFADPFGYTWHVYPADEPFLSNGQHSGRWLDI